MQILEDVLISLCNFRHIGRVLSKRPIGMVTGSFLLLVLLYSVVFGMWYSSVFGDFVDIALGLAKPKLPAFNITNGQLTMHSPEPYIITHKDVYQIIKDAILEINKKRFGGRYEKEIKEGLEREEIGPEQSFCLIMDTTGAYKERIALDNYSRYAVINKDSIEAVDRIKTFPGNIVPIREKVKQDITFSTDVVGRLNAPLKRLGATAIIIGLFIFTPAHFLTKALISAFIVWLVLLIANKKRPYGIIYKLSLYALSPVVLLAVIHRLWLPIHGAIFQLLYFACVFTATSAVPKATND